MLLHPSPYAEIPQQPWNPMLAGANSVNSVVTKSQRAQPENTEDWVYGLKSEVWPYGLFPAGHMGTKLRVTFVYNSRTWVI